jgi:flagellar hook-associated protein 2
MSTSSIPSTSTSTSTAGLQLNSLGTGSSQQITGLASGLNTDAIITEEMAIYQQPVTNLQNVSSGLTAENKQLTSIQTALQTLAADAQALGDPALFQTTQSVTSSDPTRVSATSSTGAGVGGYQVSVTALANSAQRTFSYASPAAADTVTIDGQAVPVAAGESTSDFVNSINSNSKLDVYAAATSTGTIVMSNRATGNTGTGFIQVSDTAGALTEQTALAKQGQDAAFSVDGVSGTSHSNTVTSAIAGVSLSLSGVTTTSGPITINVAAPAPNSANIESAINTYATQYNAVIAQIQTQLTQAPSSSDPTQGTLYGDPELQSLLGSMRTAMASSGSGLPTGMADMIDIGLSTGATTGSGAVSQSALTGNLSLNATTLESALASNPAGVHSVMGSWASSFSIMLNQEADPGGTIDSRIQGDSAQVTQLGNQISSMQSALTDKQNTLVQQFAALEAALSSNQSTASWLTSQIAALPTIS